MIQDRKLISASIVFVMVLSGLMIGINIPEGPIPLKLSEKVSASFAGGDGSASNPYQISNVSQLQNISSNLSAHYVLINDIDATSTKEWNYGRGFEPLERFYGSFDGRNHTIEGLFIKKYSTYGTGLFTENSGIIKNLLLRDVNITGRWYVGGLMGRNSGRIVNSISEGNVSGDQYVGGLVGGNFWKGEIKNSTSGGNISGNNDFGGLIGKNDGGNIFNSYYCINITNINLKKYVTPYGIYEGQYNEWMRKNRSLDVDDYLTYDSNSGYYLINSLEDIKETLPFSAIRGMRFKLMSDINLSSEPGFYIPVMTDGTFEGNGYSISNLDASYYNNERVGFIGIIGGYNEISGVRNITLVNGKVYGHYHVGTLVGENFGAIYNCSASGSANGSYFNLGGLIGSNWGYVLNCTYYGNVNGYCYVGGVIGVNAMGKVRNCEFNGTVRGREFVGGLVGSNGISGSEIIVNCSAVGEVEGTKLYCAGGLIGDNIHNAEIISCQSHCNVNKIGLGEAERVGGFIGYGSGEFKNCYSTGVVKGEYRIGGFIGYGVGARITSCYSLGDVSGTGIDREQIGGFAGYSLRSVSDSYSMGSVDGKEAVGGFIGENDGTISRCYSTGKVRGTTNVGGFVGENTNNVNSCFWNKETSGMVTSDGGTGKTTAEMTSNITFSGAGWDIDKEWGIFNGYSYPFLRWEDNSAPAILSSNEQNAVEDKPYENWYSSSDPDHTDIKQCWTIKTEAKWLTMDPLNGSLKGIPRNDDVGEWWINVTASDGRGGSDFTNFTIFVENVNDKPAIQLEILPDATEDEPYSIDIKVLDIDPVGDILNWRIADTDATFLNIDPSTGNLTGIPKNDDVGEWFVIINVTDGNGGFDEVEFLLTVLNTNDDPKILEFEIPEVLEDEFFYLDLDAIDIDPTLDTLYWSLETDASFLSIDLSTGNLSGIPINDDVGKWWVLVNVSDGKGGFDERNLTLTVLNVNDDPEILEFDIPEVLEDELSFIDITAIDIDPTEDVLDWSLDTDALFLSIDPSTGNLSGIPTNDDVGEWLVNVTVSDGNGGYDFRNFTIEVLNVNDPPELNQTTLSLTFDEDSNGTRIDLNDIFLDIDGDDLSFEFSSSENLTFTLEESVLEIVPDTDWCGQEIIKFTALDGEESVSLDVSVEVTPVNDAPTDVEIFAGSIYTEGQDQILNSTATDVDIPFGDELIFSWYSNISGELGEGQSINLSLPVGHHLITLTVTDSGGLYSQGTIEMEIISKPIQDDDGKDESEENDMKSSTIMIIVGAIILILIVILVIVFFVLKKKPDEEDNEQIEKGSTYVPDEIEEQIPVDIQQRENGAPDGYTMEPSYPVVQSSEPLLDKELDIPVEETPIQDEVLPTEGVFYPEQPLQQESPQVEDDLNSSSEFLALQE